MRLSPKRLQLCLFTPEKRDKIGNEDDDDDQQDNASKKEKGTSQKRKRWQGEGTVSEMGLNDVRIEIVGEVYELNELKNNQRGAAALLNSIISSLDL